MKKPPVVIALSPNAEADDVQLAKRLIVHPKQYQFGDYILPLQRAFEAKFSNSSIFLTNSGRSALYVAIKSLQLQNTDEVLIQGYTCNAVPNPILWAGARPRYVDIDPVTLTMSISDLRKKITDQSKVIIVQHTFGYPADIVEIMKIASEHKLIVIEDCAHALGASVNRTTVGSFGDMAILSFGRDKVISSVYGGALIVNNRAYIAAVEKIYATLLLPKRWWVLQQLLHPLLFSFGLRYYNSVGKVLLATAKHMHLLSKAVTSAENKGKKPAYFPGKLPNALAALVHQQLNKLNDFQQHRAKLIAYYKANLTIPDASSVQQSLDNAIVTSAFLRYIVLVENPQVLIQFAKTHGIMLGDWYNAVVTPAATDLVAVGYNPGDCPQAEIVSKHSVNLPTHINISMTDAHYIVSVINSFYS